jgi:hypothetical protein
MDIDNKITLEGEQAVPCVVLANKFDLLKTEPPPGDHNRCSASPHPSPLCLPLSLSLYISVPISVYVSPSLYLSRVFNTHWRLQL